jgi:hypothetical protein
MSLTSIEYVVRRVWISTGEVKSQHGPYDTLEHAETQKRGGERTTDEHPARRNLEEWVIMERTVTEWEPVPTDPPDWPEED